MLLRNVWSNFLIGVKNVGSFVYRHLPTILKGAKYVSKFFERSANPAIAGAAHLTSKGLDWAEWALDKYNTGADVVDIGKEALDAIGSPPSTSEPMAEPVYTRPAGGAPPAPLPKGGWRGGTLDLD